MVRIDDDPLTILGALVSIETQDTAYQARPWEAAEGIFQAALRILVHDDEAGEQRSLPVALAYWREHRDDAHYAPFSVYGIGGMNRYFVLKSGEIVLSEKHLPRGAMNTPLRELYIKRAEQMGVRMQ